MLFKMSAVFLAAALAFAGLQTFRLSALSDKSATSKLALGSCGNRLNNLITDLEADHEIDELPDTALTVVPSWWLLDSPSGE